MLLCLALLPKPVQAEESTVDILHKSRERGALNLLDVSADMVLTTTTRSETGVGETKRQVVTSAARRVEGRMHSLTRFFEPPSVAGMKVLTVQGGKGEGDDISLYLPKLKRVRKVAKSQRGESFMQTDFNYADLGSTGGAGEDSFVRKPDTKVDSHDVYVLAGQAGPDSPYGSITAYVDKETYVPVKVEYTDKAGKPLKVFRVLEMRKFKDRFFSSKSLMENLQTGSQTTLEVVRLEESKLGEDAFTERALERG